MAARLLAACLASRERARLATKALSPMLFGRETAIIAVPSNKRVAYSSISDFAGLNAAIIILAAGMRFFAYSKIKSEVDCCCRFYSSAETISMAININQREGVFHLAQADDVWNSEWYCVEPTGPCKLTAPAAMPCGIIKINYRHVLS